MQPKDLATVRVSNLSPTLGESTLHHFLDRRNVNATSHMSLCPHSSAKDSVLVATVTFDSPQSAKKALNLNGRVLAGRNVSIERDFMGLTVLGTPKHPKLDIIAVHGLNGNAYGTWAHHEKGQPGFESMWLRDFIPNNVKQARILVYGYNSALLGSHTSVSSVKDFANDLLQRIMDDRAHQDEPRPLIFICHSMGGIVVKQALVSAHEDPERYHGIAAATGSILFLATPHRGSKTANIGSLLSHVASLAFQSPSKQLLETLKYDSNTLSQLSQEFREIHSAFDIINFYERRKTPGLNSLVVDETSSKLGVEGEVFIPIDATHGGICRFQNEVDPLFLPVLAQIKRCSIRNIKIDDAPARKKATPTTVTGHFMVPVSPNPQFVGRTEQLQLLEDCLSTQGLDRSSNYPIVAVHGLGGVGKTQLATKFVYDRKLKKPWASTFWVSARNVKEIDAGFQDFAKKLSLVHNADGGIGYTNPELNATAEAAAEIKSQPDGVDLLKSWMLTPGHEDWLLVLDNFDDMQVKINRFLPTGAFGGVLITTRDRNVIGSVATSGFPLTAMDLFDAERLFLRIQNLGADPNLQRSAPDSEHQVLKQILEELQFFPLAIDQAASFIRENSPMTLREYQTYLKPRSVDRERLLRFKQTNPTYPDSVMTTWEISLHYLERRHPRASWILQLLGFLDHSNISEELLTAVTKPIPWSFDTTLLGKQLHSKYHTQMAFLKHDVGFRRAIGTLVSLSLIQRNITTLRVHPLVHEWIRVRLNPKPQQQARFTNVAALLLYHYLPSEMVVWLGPCPMSFPLVDRINQISHHIRAVLANLRDYAMRDTTILLECFVLCEVYYLAGSPKHSDLRFDISNALLVDLDHVIKMMISKILPDQRSLAGFIHKAISLLRGGLRLMNRTTQLAESLESLHSKVSLADCPDDFFMLLASSVVDVCDTLKHTLDEKLVFDNDRGHQKITDRKEQRRHISYRLFESLQSLLFSMDPMSTPLRKTRLAINIRLLEVMTPEEYAIQKQFDIKTMLSSGETRSLDFNTKAAYLCRLAELLLGYRGPKDFVDLQNVFSAVVDECSAMRIKARQSRVQQEERAYIRASSRSSYISSSFGRAHVPEKMYTLEDIFTPLDYIWANALIVAQIMSDPGQQWKTSRIDDTCIGPLDLPQRRWSIDLISSISRVYRLCLAERDRTTGTNARFLNYFSKLSVRYCLINIYANLEDWEMLQHELVMLLKCDKVLSFCNRLESFPWETPQAANAQGNIPSSPPSPKPRHDFQETSWLSLGTRQLKAAKGLVSGRILQIPSVSSRSDPPLATKLQDPEAKAQNAAAEIEARLEAAAAQRQSRLKAIGNNPLRRDVFGDKPSRLQDLGLPDSCNRIADPNVDSAITHFFTLAQKMQLLDNREASNLRLKIRVVAQMSSESGAKYLGNLEMIYQLAKRLSAKSPKSMDVEYLSDDGEHVDDIISGDTSDMESSDEEGDEEMYDDHELGQIAGTTGAYWGW